MHESSRLSQERYYPEDALDLFRKYREKILSRLGELLKDELPRFVIDLTVGQIARQKGRRILAKVVEPNEIDLRRMLRKEYHWWFPGDSY